MTTVYLSPTGSDSYTYVQAQSALTPWLTIGKCYTSATNGDTVSMAAGTYSFSANIGYNIKSLTFVGAALSNNFPTTILDGGSASRIWQICNSQNLTMSNIWIKNVANDNSTTYGLFDIVFTNGGTGNGTITLTNCAITGFQADGSTSETGNMFNSSSTQPYTLVATSCLFALKRKSSAAGSFARFCGGRTYTVNLTNCDVYTDGSSGTLLTSLFGGQSTTQTLTFQNTIMYAASAVTFNNHSGTKVVVATNSDFYQLTGSPSGTGVITSDPLFVRPSLLDFRLRPASPCIGMGVLI